MNCFVAARAMPNKEDHEFKLLHNIYHIRSNKQEKYKEYSKKKWFHKIWIYEKNIHIYYLNFTNINDI